MKLGSINVWAEFSRPPANKFMIWRKICVTKCVHVAALRQRHVQPNKRFHSMTFWILDGKISEL